MRERPEAEGWRGEEGDGAGALSGGGERGSDGDSGGTVALGVGRGSTFEHSLPKGNGACICSRCRRTSRGGLKDGTYRIGGARRGIGRYKATVRVGGGAKVGVGCGLANATGGAGLGGLGGFCIEERECVGMHSMERRRRVGLRMQRHRQTRAAWRVELGG